MASIFKKVASILPYLFVFIASLYLPTDPDLGWHLKYGEYFFQHHQILRDNIFSTMMPNHHWVNGTWGTDVITYAVYKARGFLGLSIASAAIVTLTFFFFARAAGWSILSETLFFPIFIYVLSPVNNNSFRGQQLSYLFFGLLLYILNKYKPFTKLFLLIPLLFLVWCNIHEEAFLFLALFGLWIAYTLIKNILSSRQQKKSALRESLFLLCSFLVSFLVTFINPFGIALHRNALSYLGNPLVKNISEYAPYQLFSQNWWNQVGVGIVLITAIIILFFKKNSMRQFPISILSLLFLLLGFSMRRYLWPAYYLTFFFISIPLQILQTYIKKSTTLASITISSLVILFILQYKFPVSTFTNMSWVSYCSLQEVPCSPESAAYLQTHHLTRNLFSYYDWGGWLIWNYPDIKPSIDGRMTEWEDINGYSAVAEYEAYENAQKDIDTSTYNIVYLPNDKSPLSAKLSQLVQQHKWKVAYEDEFAGVVVRIDKSYSL